MIEIITGPMFSGKSEELIRRLRRAEIAKKHFLVFKSQLDDRFEGTKTIGSRSGLTYPCTPVKDSSAIYDTFYRDYYGNKVPSIVAIDEAQFFDEDLPTIVNHLADLGVRVIISGLDTDYRDEPFGPMPILLALADDVQKLTAVCTSCGGEATKTFRITDDEERIKIGSSGLYEARCRQCNVKWR